MGLRKSGKVFMIDYFEKIIAAGNFDGSMSGILSVELSPYFVANFSKAFKRK